MSVEEDEQNSLKGEQCSETSSVGIQPSDGKRKLAPSNSVKRPSWYEMILGDAQEQVESFRSTFRESRPLDKFPNFRTLMTSMIDSDFSSVREETDQQVWRDAMGHDDVHNILPRSEGTGFRWLFKKYLPH
jgi:hypothetical protein